MMLKSLLVLAMVAVFATAQPEGPKLPSTWSSFITLNTESVSFFGALYLDYSSNNQRTDVVSLLASNDMIFQEFDSSGQFTTQSVVYSTASAGNVPGCVSTTPTGKVIPQDLSDANFVGVSDWYGTPAYLWSFKDNGESFSLYTNIKTSGLLALEAYNDTTNAVDSFVTFTGFSDALPQGAFAVPTPLCKSSDDSDSLAADAPKSAHRNALFSLINRFANVASNE